MIDIIAQEQKITDNIIKYNMGKHLWLCWTKQMCLFTVPDVSDVTNLIHKYNQNTMVEIDLCL